MLRKLMKHEFRATGRIMLPLYLVLLVTAIGANITTRGLLETKYRILDVLGTLLIMAFFIAIFAACIMSMVVMVQRFYKNLLQDEGYVMLTLPVSIHQQIWSKLIVSAVWFAATLLAVILAVLVMSFDIQFIGQFFRGVRLLLEDLNAHDSFNGMAFMAELLALCFFSCCAMCLQFYAALSIGHSFASHKMAWSVGCFFGLQFASLFLISLLIILADTTGFDYFLANCIHIPNHLAALHISFLSLTVLVVLYGAVFYGITVFFLKKHLNLE